MAILEGLGQLFSVFPADEHTMLLMAPKKHVRKI
jgi:hypothetical protein